MRQVFGSLFIVCVSCLILTGCCAFYCCLKAPDNILTYKERVIFDVEDKSHTELPLNVQNILKANAPEAYNKCDLVGSLVDIGSSSGEKYYAVSGRAGKCGGSASAPVWIARMNEDKAAIILSGGGYHIEALPNLNNGLQDLRTSGGNAGSAFVEYWKYDGKIYRVQTRKDFDGSCENFKNDPDNPFDCSGVEKVKND